MTRYMLAIRWPEAVVLLLAALTTVAAAAEAPATSSGPPAGFRALCNDLDLTGWWGLGSADPAVWAALSADELEERQRKSLENINAHWRVENGELVNDGQGLYLTTDEHFADFELLLDYKTVAGADSGIYLRGIPQVQIWDYTRAGGKWSIGADKGSGGLWNNASGAPGKDPLTLADKPFGEWNSFRIIMVGERVTVYLNDQLVVDHARMANYFDRSSPVPRSGPIQLQTHGGEIRWRNVFIREIEPDEANDILHAGARATSPHQADFVSIFNGRDFTGWAGPVENYVVEDGAIQCRPHQGGTIYTTEEFDDFVVRFEFRLPPGGNNGLAIRYPGQGDTAYVGMCELQVLDDTHAKYAGLDPRQYHGSIYGQVAAKRGYLREPGQWNFQEVTVRGSTIRVELNGTVIVDADVTNVTDFLHDPERFVGRLRTSGHFGFAGHGDPVAFRGIEIRRLSGD